MMLPEKFWPVSGSRMRMSAPDVVRVCEKSPARSAAVGIMYRRRICGFFNLVSSTE
jgi:hypothetical protein